MDNKRIHFIGIGGIGVSALAKYYLAQGILVSGSDAAESEITEELRGVGAKIFVGHREDLDSRLQFTPHLMRGGNDNMVVVYSAAVREDNPELAEARRRGIKCQKYAEALGELTKQKYTIAISGMHGKSTTTAMVGLIMEAAGLDPTVIVGTKVRWMNQESGIRSQGSNFRAGCSEYLVIEADEYDRSFLNYWPKILVVLNIEEEHLDTYVGGLPDIMETFKEYILHLPEDGVLVANGEDQNAKESASQAKCKIIYYSLSGTSPFVSGEAESRISQFFPEARSNDKRALRLKIPGKHNISNANAALAVTDILGIDRKIAIEALNNFNGTWRRMEYKGEVNGAKIYDDYGHHPTEIKATLEGARELLSANGHSPSAKLWCVFRPHQYQRTYKLFDKFVSAFDEADKLILLPIFSVEGREDEEIKKKVSSEMLVLRLQAQGKPKETIYVDSFDKATDYLKRNLKPGDVCLIMGAGDVYKITQKLI